MQIAMEASISLTLAFFNIKTMFPAALAIAPGLLKGSIRTKMLIPQSIIPGMFIMVLPWLAAPLTWCMYSLAFQLVGNIYLLFGLMFLAFAPVTYFLVAYWKKFAAPMGDAEAEKVIKAIDRTVLCVTFLSSGLLLMYVIHVALRLASAHADELQESSNVVVSDLLKGMENQLGPTDSEIAAGKSSLESVLFEGIVAKCSNTADFWRTFLLMIFTFLASFLRGYWLAAAAGFDWMMGEMVMFRNAEKIDNERLKHSSWSDGDAVNHAEERNHRLDMLCAIADNNKQFIIPKGEEQGHHFSHS